jgi:hypothetical protein
VRGGVVGFTALDIMRGAAQHPQGAIQEDYISWVLYAVEPTTVACSCYSWCARFLPSRVLWLPGVWH